MHKNRLFDYIEMVTHNMEKTEVLNTFLIQQIAFKILGKYLE